MPYFIEKQALTQTIHDSIYIGFSVFGLGCMTLVLGGGIQKEDLSLNAESKLRLITIAPQLVIVLVFLGKVEPERYPFDYFLITVAYCLAVASLIWTGYVTKYQYLATLNNDSSDVQFSLKPNALFIKALLQVIMSALITWFLLWLFDENKTLSGALGIFSALLGVIILFEKSLNSPAKYKN